VSEQYLKSLERCQSDDIVMADKCFIDYLQGKMSS